MVSILAPMPFPKASGKRRTFRPKRDLEMRDASIHSRRRRSQRALSSSSLRRREKSWLTGGCQVRRKYVLLAYLARNFSRLCWPPRTKAEPFARYWAPMSAADIDAIFTRRPGLMTDGITVKDLRAA